MPREANLKCGEIPRVWWFRDVAFRRGSELHWVGERKIHGVLWGTVRCFGQLVQDTDRRVWCVSVCSSLHLWRMNNAWNSAGVAGESISYSTLIKNYSRVLYDMSSLLAHHEEYEEILKVRKWGADKMLIRQTWARMETSWVFSSSVPVLMRTSWNLLFLMLLSGCCGKERDRGNVLSGTRLLELQSPLICVLLSVPANSQNKLFESLC